MSDRSFAPEIAYFDQHVDGWMKSGVANRWVVIHGNELFGDFASLAEAFYAGRTRYDEGDFLVKKVGPDRGPARIRNGPWNTRDARAS